MKASCQCGKITATVADDAQSTTIICHCLDCQRRTGSPSGTIAYFPREAVTVSGTPSEYSRAGDSGHTLTRGFCPECGAAVYVKASRMPEITGVPVGAFADPAFPAPVRSIYEQSKHAWVEPAEGVTHHPRGRETSW
jgi:hypothetical protein